MTDFTSLFEKLREVIAREIGVSITESHLGDLVEIPPGVTVKPLEDILGPLQQTPPRHKGVVTCKSVSGFVDYINRFESAKSTGLIKLNPKRDGPKFVCQLNHHADGDPQWCDFGCDYAPELSLEWIAWTAASKASFTQAEFSEFLEEHANNIVAPPVASEGGPLIELGHLLGLSYATPAEIIGLSRAFQVKVGSEIKQARTLQSGEAELVFKEEHRDTEGRPVRIPGLFVIAIPVFDGGDIYALPVRLRYRMAAGGVSFKIAMHKPERTFDDALAGLRDYVVKNTQVQTIEAV